jgi:hypothetical protein
MARHKASDTASKAKRAVSASESETPAYNPSWLRTKTAEGLGIIEELSSYLSYLEGARDRKSRTPTTSAGFEREALAQARRAERNTRRLLGGSLGILKHLESAGFVDDALRHWTKQIEGRGKISFAEQWKELIESEKVVARFHKAGVSSHTLERLTEAATRLTRPIEARDGELIVRRPEGPPIVLKRRTLLRGTIADVLLINHFDAAAELFERTDVAPGAVLGHSHADEEQHVDPLEAFLAVATRAQRRVTAHVRKLEDTGLAVYEGADPVDAIIVIVAVAIVAAIIIGIVCEKTDAEGDVCDLVDSIAAALGFIAAAAVCADNPEECDIVVVTEASRSRLSDGTFGFRG